MLIHAMHKWPDIITTKLWPFTLKLAIDIQNAPPTDSSLSPEEIFTGRESRSRTSTHLVVQYLCQRQHCDKDSRSQNGNQDQEQPYIQVTHLIIILNIRIGLVLPQHHICLQMNMLLPNWNELFQQRSKNSLKGKPPSSKTHAQIRMDRTKTCATIRKGKASHVCQQSQGMRVRSC